MENVQFLRQTGEQSRVGLHRQREEINPFLRKRTSTEKGVIVVAHSDGHVRRVLALKLRAYGFRVVELSNGVELLEMLGGALVPEDTKQIPDLVIADEDLRTYKGMDILIDLRDFGISIPFLLTTHAYSEDSASRVRNLDKARMVRFPMDWDDFLTIVLYLVRQSNPRCKALMKRRPLLA